MELLYDSFYTDNTNLKSRTHYVRKGKLKATDVLEAYSKRRKYVFKRECIS